MGPTICKPTGIPDSVKAQETDMAGDTVKVMASMISISSI